MTGFAAAQRLPRNASTMTDLSNNFSFDKIRVCGGANEDIGAGVEGGGFVRGEDEQFE
jgi:hypothetical protein